MVALRGQKTLRFNFATEKELRRGTEQQQLHPMWLDLKLLSYTFVR